MKAGLLALAAIGALASTGASAQVLDLSGQFRCMQDCADGLVGQPAFITQHGWDMRLVNEAGVPSRAWIDHPGHIWVDRWQEGAVYSPDGMTIQFHNGTVWERDIGQWGPAAPPPPVYGPPGYGPPPVYGPPVYEPPGAEAPPPVERPAAAAVPAVPAVPAKTARVKTAPGRTAPARTAPVRTAALNAYDGTWSVEIITEHGDCDRAYRYAVRINNGRLVNEIGEAVNLDGRVAPNGAVSVNVAAGGQHASGVGRLSATTGRGTWSGVGSVGACGGVWEAERRG